MSDARDTLAILLLDLWRLPLADRPDAILSALSAAGYVVEQGWQDIATAPRDRPTQVIQDSEQAVVTWMTAIEDGEGDWIIWRQIGPDALAIRMPAPTHWRHLPAPPAQETQP